jgi:hypothetical protein
MCPFRPPVCAGGPGRTGSWAWATARRRTGPTPSPRWSPTPSPPSSPAAATPSPSARTAACVPPSLFFSLPCSSNKPSDSGLPVTQLFTWGWNQRGTLGHPPETKTESCPGPVDALAGVRIVQAAIGGWHCLAVDDKGRAYAWGEGNQLPPATRHRFLCGLMMQWALMVQGETSTGSAARSLRGRRTVPGRSGGTSPSRSGARPSSKSGK